MSKSIGNSKLEIYEVLQEEDKKYGLGKNFLEENPGYDLDKYLDIREPLKLDAEELYERAYVLTKIGFYIRRIYNKKKAVLSRVQGELDLYVNRESNKQREKFVPKDEIRANIIYGDSYAGSLNKKFFQLKSEVSNLEFISERIYDMSQSLTNIARSKQWAKEN